MYKFTYIINKTGRIIKYLLLSLNITGRKEKDYLAYLLKITNYIITLKNHFCKGILTCSKVDL